MKHRTLLLAALAVLVIFACRWFGPSDLYDNDQPKTVAYTVDMVRHGHWLLPMDMLGRPATKPPMYNWLGAPAVAMGWHNEFALKLPSTLAALFTVFLTWCIARQAAVRATDRGFKFQPNGHNPKSIQPLAVAAIASIGLMTNFSIAKLCYTARPDMVLTAFITAGWAAASFLLIRVGGGSGPQGHTPDLDRRLQGCARLTLWLCVAGAALAKGPPALLLILYVVLGAKLIAGRWSAIRETGIAWGMPMALVLFGAWAYSVYRINPEHFFNQFLGHETVGRVGRGGVVGIISEFWKMPGIFMLKFLPWSVFAVLAGWDLLAAGPMSKCFTRPLGPSLLWVILVVVFFSLSGGKRADYLAPAYPAASVLVALWLATEGRRRLRLETWQVAAAGLALALVIAGYELTGSDAARSGYGESLHAFVRQVQKQTGGQPIRFENTGYTPVQSLLGYNQPDGESSRSPDGPWLVKPLDGPGAVIVSAPISDGGKDHTLVLALYTVKPPDRDRGAAPR